MRQNFKICGHTLKPGETKKFYLDTVPLYTGTTVGIPIFVKHGRKDGPVLLVCAAVHGDELNGIEILSRLINGRASKTIKGTVIFVPMVNGHGVLDQSRYMPDRRDLNRCFPGSKKGSLAGRVAHLFLNEVVMHCDVLVDLHTGAIHRDNLPQIRANLDDETTLMLAKAFGVPVIINSNVRDGSLRGEATSRGKTTLLYEAGEALRFDEFSIRAGVRGILNIMRHLDMINSKPLKRIDLEPKVAPDSGWVRASESGFVVHKAKLGESVEAGDVLATIKGPFGEVLGQVVCSTAGIVIGKQNIPLVQEGEAVYHIAFFEKPERIADDIELMQDTLVTEGGTSVV